MRVRVRATVLATMIGALLGAASASAQVSTEHSGWLWSNPQPQGELLDGVSFAGGAGYAVGIFGTALRTDNAGATWTSLPTGLYGNLTQVDAVTATTVIIGGECVLRRSDDGGKTWVRLPWTASDSSCPQQIATIDFPTADTGYLLLSGGTMLRTVDGGQSWARVAAPPTSPTAAMVFSSPSTGFAAGAGISMTTDGGTTWTVVDPSALDVSAIGLDGPAGVVAFAKAGPQQYLPPPTLYLSGDGGQTWIANTPSSFTASPVDGRHLDCMNGTGCLLSGAGAVYRTTDGSTFAIVQEPNLDLTAAAFASPTQAVAVSVQGIPVVSADGGATFTVAGGKLPPGFYGLRASSGALATLSGSSGELALTSNGGATWSVLDTPTTNSIVDASFLSPSAGFALDSTGAVLRTANGGSSWQTLGSQPGGKSILALGSGPILVGGSRGIERSANGGQSFAAVERGVIRRIQPAGGALVAYGPSHAYASSDAGASWRPIALPPHFLRGENVRQLAFMSARAGFLLGTAGRIFETSDGGEQWREVLGLGHGATLSIAFTSARNGWASEGIADGTPGVVLRTSDGGASWRPQRAGSLQIEQLDAAGHEGYALDGTGDVFVTGSDRDLGGPSSVSLAAPRKAGKHHRVTVTGRLVPNVSGASVEINYRAVAGGHWVHHFVTAGAGGRFSLVGLQIARPTAFVAQWAGDITHRGAGSPAVIVKP